MGDGITYTIYSNKSELKICKLAYFISEIHKSNLNKKKGGKRHMTIYIVTFQTYGTGEFQVSYNVFSKRKDAELEAKQLRACGHTQVTVVKREVRF